MRLNRLFLLLGVGIIMPSIFLMYLGFSSLRAEKRLREKEVTERLGTSVDAWMLQVEASLQAAMEAHEGWQFSAVMDAQGHWIDPFRQAVEFSWPALTARRVARLAAIEHTDVIQKDYLKAADDYDLLAWNLESPPWTAELLLRAARCRRKAQAWAQAEESLDHVSRRYSDLHNEHGVPFGLLAATELAEIYAASSHIDRAINKALDILANLERRAWVVSWTDEKLFAQRLHAHLREWAPHMTEAQESRWQDLAQSLNARAARVQMLEQWQTDEWPRIQAILRAGGRTDRPTLVWPAHNDDLVLWMNPEIDADGGRRVRTEIAWCQRATIEELWRHSIRGSSAQAGFTAQIQPVAKGAVDGVKRRFNTIAPPMELHIRATGSSADAYVATRKRISWAIIFLAGVVFIMALRIARQSLEREVDVAWLSARFVDTLSPKIKALPSITEFIGHKLRLKGYRNPQEAEEYYALLREDTFRLKNIIEEVLDFSLIMGDRAPYPPLRFDWAPSLRQAIDGFRESGLGRGVAIDVASSLAACLIEGHEEALSRAVLILLENAVQYSPPDRVELHVLMRREGDHVLLDVVDHGDGISPSEQALVFDRFYRGASAQERSIPGAGLGLSVARYIIQAHHGTLTLQSTLRKGSTFTVRLPLFPIQ